jgi:hypothetical protein
LESIYTSSYYDALDPKPVLALSMHAALDTILFPYGYKRNQFPSNVDEIIDMGNRAIDALNAVHGQQFTLLNAADLCKISRKNQNQKLTYLYVNSCMPAILICIVFRLGNIIRRKPIGLNNLTCQPHLLPDEASGASDDYYTSEGSRFVFTPELRDNGFGFLLPPEYIIPSGEEFWAAFITMLDIILEEKKKQ